MGRRRKQAGGIDFGVRKISGCGIVSSSLFGAEAVLFLAAVYAAYLRRGEAGIMLGAAGFLVLVMSAAGMVFGIYGAARSGYRHTADWFGIVSNTAALAGICVLFYQGTL